MSDSYPKCIALWRGAILGGLVHAIMAADNALFGSYRYWYRQDYLATNMQGMLGMVSFDGEQGRRLLGTFFDSNSKRSPYMRPDTYDVECVFRGMSTCHRCLLDSRRPHTVEWDDGIPCVTTAFWDDGEDYLTAADPWGVVIDEGAKLVRIECMENIDEALSEWANSVGMKPEQVQLARSLFDRKMAQETDMIDLTVEEFALLRSSSGKPSDEVTDEERLTVCRHRLAALGILIP